jgi:coenzyme Q-binding protein COQ10
LYRSFIYIAACYQAKDPELAGFTVRGTVEIYTEKRRSPYTPEQMFDLVADVERYEEFLPGWHYARIVKRDADVVYVDQEVGRSGFHTQFRAQAVFKRPERIHITATEAPFRQLTIHWAFEEATEFGCFIDFNVGFELRPALLKRLMGRICSDLMQRVIPAFERRAHLLYAHTTKPAQPPG